MSVCTLVCVCVYMCVCACVYVCACMHGHAYTCVYVFIGLPVSLHAQGHMIATSP